MNVIIGMRNKNFRKEELWLFTMNWEETFELRIIRDWIDSNRKSNKCLKCIKKGGRIQSEIWIDQLYNLNFISGQPMAFFNIFNTFRNFSKHFLVAFFRTFFSISFSFFSKKSVVLVWLMLENKIGIDVI